MEVGAECQPERQSRHLSRRRSQQRRSLAKQHPAARSSSGRTCTATTIAARRAAAARRLAVAAVAVSVERSSSSERGGSQQSNTDDDEHDNERRLGAWSQIASARASTVERRGRRLAVKRLQHAAAAAASAATYDAASRLHSTLASRRRLATVENAAYNQRNDKQQRRHRYERHFGGANKTQSVRCFPTRCDAQKIAASAQSSKATDVARRAKFRFGVTAKTRLALVQRQRDERAAPHKLATATVAIKQSARDEHVNEICIFFFLSYFCATSLRKIFRLRLFVVRLVGKSRSRIPRCSFSLHASSRSGWLLSPTQNAICAFAFSLIFCSFSARARLFVFFA